MKEILLSQGKYALVDDEDFDKVSQLRWLYKTDPWRYGNGYAVHFHKGRVTRMHRLVLNAPKELFVDHKNGNGLDNRKSNLRLCTKSQNAMNSRVKKTNSSGLKGVYWDHGKWASKIRIGNKSFTLGRYCTKQSAMLAYRIISLFYFGEFAYAARSIDESAL